VRVRTCFTCVFHRFVFSKIHDRPGPVSGEYFDIRIQTARELSASETRRLVETCSLDVSSFIPDDDLIKQSKVMKQRITLL
jgi:hypothetical protein